MKRILAILVILLLNSVSALATPIVNVPLPGGFFDNQYSTGSGSNTAYFVVDFGGNSGNTYGFVYHWDSTQAADTALIAIDANGGLDMATENFGSVSEPNLGIDTFSYPPDSDTPDFFDDGRFWTYFLGIYNGTDVSWTGSDYGISGREFGDDGNHNGTPNEILQTLADGEFYGFYASADFTVPRLPVAVPEPAALTLTVVGGLLLLGGSIRRRRFLLRDAVERAQAPH